MAEPEVRYCTTSDGIQIAFRVSGEGPGTPLVFMTAPPFGGLKWPEALGRTAFVGRRWAMFDFRGTGLSDRRITDMSMAALMLDLEAVIERLGWSQFALHGQGMSGPIAVQYAHAHPERVTSLILRETYARASEMGRIPRMRVLGAALRADWETYLELMALMAGWTPDGPAVVSAMRENLTKEVVEEIVAATPTYDVSSIVGEISVRTLVIGREDMPVPSPEMVRQLGARIRDARVVMVGGGRAADAESMRVIDEFLAEGDGDRREGTLPAGTALILFADIAESTALTERLGDAAFRDRARKLDGALREAIRASGGTAVEGRLVGDGLMAVFTSARDAIGAAMQCRLLSEECELQLHLGIHAGDVIREENNVFGGAVNIASRISALSAPGEVLVSATVRDLARTSAGVTFEDRGEFVLKGVGDPVRVYAVRTEGA